MKPRVLTLLLCAALIGPVAAERADVVTEWNAAALDAIRAEKTPPPPASRALAILHISIYDEKGAWRDGCRTADTNTTGAASACEAMELCRWNELNRRHVPVPPPRSA